MELEKYEPNAAAELLAKVKNFCLSKGIIVTQKISSTFGAAENSDADNQWIKNFIIQTDAQAFYLEIHSRDDIAQINENLTQRVSTLQGKVKNFLKQNSDIDADLQRKIKSLGVAVLEKATAYIKFGLKKALDSSTQNCNTFEELREAVGKCYRDFIKQYFVERILAPLYDGLKQNPRVEAYIWLLNEVNQFLADLGVATVNVKIGERFNDNQPYELSAESNLPENLTADPQEKDIIRAVLRYAYVFQEDGETLTISEGELIVATFRQEGAN